MKLQQGNFVYKCYPDGKEIIEVQNISKNFINELGISAIEPIPLTEEWLLKLGYWKLDNKDVHFVTKGHLIWKCNDLLMCEKNGIILKHVHQLQNLYLALTQTELIIK